MITVEDVPRVDRGTIWARAEELTRLNPLMPLSASLYQAAYEYETKTRTHPIESKLWDTCRDNPESLFQKPE